MRNPREKTPVAASNNVSPGEEPRQPSPLPATTHSEAALRLCTAVKTHLLVGFLTEPSGWDVLKELTSHVTFLRKLLPNVLH